MIKVAHEFYLGFAPKAYGEWPFLYRIMEGHVGNTGEFVKGPHPQGYIYDLIDNVTVGVLSLNPVSDEKMAWDIEHMLDIKCFDVDVDKPKKNEK
jgi:hypothetical protein